MEVFDPLRVNFALAYPFARPARDYIYTRGCCLPIVERRGDALSDWIVEHGTVVRRLGEIMGRDAAGCRAFSDSAVLLAAGSNASPVQLGRKFASEPEVVIPVLKVRVTGWVVRYARHIAPYGSIPTAFVRAPGAVSEVFANFVCGRAREMIDATEGLGTDYRVADIPDVEVLSAGQSLSAYAYESCQETLPLAPDMLGACTGTAPRASQWEVQEDVIARLEEPVSVPEFIWQNATDNELRQRREDRLRAERAV